MSITTQVWTCNTGWSDEEQFRIEAIWSYSQDVANNTTTIKLEKLRFLEVRQLCLAGQVVTFEGGWSGNTASGDVTLTQTWGPPYYEEVTINKSKTFSNDSNGYAQGLYIQWRCYVTGKDGRVPKQSSLQTQAIESSSVPRVYRYSGLNLSASSVTMGNAVTCSIDAKSSAYTHKLYYTFGSLSDKPINESIAAGTTSVSWTPLLMLAGEIPNTTSGTATVKLDTYSGSTKIGSVSKTITLYVPTDIVPSLTVDISDANGYYSTFGAYVSGKSKLKVASTGSGRYSSTITGYSVTVQGSKYSGSSVTSNLLTGSGTAYWEVTVTDSRGRTTTKSGSITVLAYTAPTASLTCYRMDSDGNIDDNGEYLRSDWSYSITSLNSKNTKTAKIQYQLNGTWTDIKTVTNGYSKSGTLKETTHALDLSTTYNVRLAVSDYFTTVYHQVRVATAFDLINFGAGGKSIAFGQRSSNDGRFEVGIPAHFNAGIETHDSNVIVTHGNAFNQIISDMTAGSAPSKELWRYPVSAFDSTSQNYLMYLETYISTDKSQRVRLAGRSKATGSNVNAYIDINISADGTISYATSNGQIADSSTYASVIPAATTSKSGLLTASDKAKLNKLDSSGASSWVWLRTVGGSSTKGVRNDFKLDTSIENYKEIMVMCVKNTYYVEDPRKYFVLGTTIVPVELVKTTYHDIEDGAYCTPEVDGHHAGVSFTSATTGYLYAYYDEARVILFAR